LYQISLTLPSSRRRKWQQRWWRPKLTVASVREGLVVGMRDIKRILVTAQKYSLNGWSIVEKFEFDNSK